MKPFIWGGAGLAVVAASAVVLASARSSRADRPDARETARVARRDIGAFVKATGVIRPRVGAEVRVGSRVSGVVTRLYVRIGDRVDKGQLLAQLDDRDFVARRDEAAAAVRQAEVNLTYTKLDLDRKRTLAAAGGISPSDREVAERAFALGEQQLKSGRATLAFATTQVEYTRIVAPIAGVVASVTTQEGETVAASFSAPTFLTLLDPSRLEVWAYVDETDIGRIKVGQSAHFTVDTYGDHAFEGRVTAVYPKAEIRDNVVNYVAVVTFTPPRDRTLRPEMTTTVRIAQQMREGVLALPAKSVRWQAGKPYVLIGRGATPERRAVTTGIRDERYVEIVNGLRDGEEVLVGDTNTNRRNNQ